MGTSTTWFTSRRERTLWLLTALAVGAIVATLELAGTLARAVPHPALFDTIFGIGALLVLIALLLTSLASRERATVALACGVGAAHVLLLARAGSPAERTHLVEYGVVAVLIHAALEERSAGGRGVAKPALAAIGAASGIGVIDEAIQWVLPSRVFDPVDIAFNVAAATAAVLALLTVRRARRRNN